MEERAYLTAFSDVFLSICSIWSVIFTDKIGSNFPGFELMSNARATSVSVGFTTFATASFLGFVRFSVLLPTIHDHVIKIHQYFAFLGSSFGLPLLAAAYCLPSKFPTLHHAFVALSIIGPFMDLTGTMERELVKEVSSVLSILTIIVTSVIIPRGNINASGVIGALCFIIGGLVIGTEGRGFLGLRNVDWFHYVISFGIISLATGIA